MHHKEKVLKFKEKKKKKKKKKKKNHSSGIFREQLKVENMKLKISTERNRKISSRWLIF